MSSTHTENQRMTLMLLTIGKLTASGHFKGFLNLYPTLAFAFGIWPYMPHLPEH